MLQDIRNTFIFSFVWYHAIRALEASSYMRATAQAFTLHDTKGMVIKMEYKKEIAEFRTKQSFTTEELLLLIRILRSENGCPWDREQDHRSIVTGLVEETYEAVEAIELGSAEMLCEELGDVLLQVCFHSVLSEESGEFTYADAVNGVCKKMIERHPHVFGDVEADTTERVLNNWDKIKAETKGQQTLADRLKAVPVTFPALMKGQKLIHRARKFGEMVEPTAQTQTQAQTQAQEQVLGGGAATEESIADALWSVLCAADSAGIDAETALRHRCEAFVAAHEA